MQIFAGALTANVSFLSGALGTSGPSGFGAVTIVAQPYGTTSRITVSTATPIYNPPIAVASPLGNGDTVFKQTFYANFDTSLMNDHPVWDIGYQYTDSATTIINWFGTYVNGNLTNNLAAYTVYAKVGSTVYHGNTAGWSTAIPALKGVIQFYISENWNSVNYAGNAPRTVNLSQFSIDGGAMTVGNLTGTYVDPTTKDTAYGLASIDTSAWTDGNHTFTWELSIIVGDPYIQILQAKTGSVSFTTNQSVIGPVGSLSVSTPDSGYMFALDGYYGTSILVTAYSVNQFAGPVAFSITGLPEFTTAVFSPPTGNVLAGQSLRTTLELNSNLTQIGSYPLTIHATSGSLDATWSFTYTVRFSIR